MTTLTQRPTCPSCGSGKIYVRRDGTIQCHRCGHDSRAPSPRSE